MAPALEQIVQQRISRRVGELVQRECCHDRDGCLGKADRREIAATSTPGDLEILVCLRRFGKRPWMAIDTDDSWNDSEGGSPRHAANSGSTSQVHNRWQRGGHARQGTDNFSNEQVVKWGVEEGE